MIAKKKIKEKKKEKKKKRKNLRTVFARAEYACMQSVSLTSRTRVTFASHGGHYPIR